jgi:hypothetical protein
MVPEYKPAASMEFLSRWIQNKEYQHYMKKPSRAQSSMEL